MVLDSLSSYIYCIYPKGEIIRKGLADFGIAFPYLASTPEELPAMAGYPDNIEISSDRADLTRSPSTISYRANSAENTPFSPSFYDHGK